MVLVRLDPYGFDHLIVGAREPSAAGADNVSTAGNRSTVLSERDPTAAELTAEAGAASAAEAFQRDDVTLNYEQAGQQAPPAPAENEPTVVRGVRLPASLDQRVRAAAAAAGVPRSA